MQKNIELKRFTLRRFSVLQRRLVGVCAISLLFQLLAGAQSLADQALEKARGGRHEEAFELYRHALTEDPNNVAVLRDYAVALGWAGKYSDALSIVRKTQSLAPSQPEWAMRQFSGIYLFGGALPDALAVLDELLRGGDSSEQTLVRRALALRWLKRPGHAEDAYRTVLAAYPNSEDGVTGLAYTLAETERFSQALALLQSSSPAILKARIRILNWAGRHYEAQRSVDQLPDSLRDDREVLEDRVAAARWGGDPSAAVGHMQRLSILHPSSDASRLSRDLYAEYGRASLPPTATRGTVTACPKNRWLPASRSM
jgi:tetratricopeptide (TPR) repeat protein